MTGINLDAVEADIVRHERAIGPGGDKAWAAGQLAQRVPALIAEIRRLTAPPATEPTERQMLVSVRRWAIANGWHLLWSGWANASFLDDATVLVEWDSEELIVRRRDKAGYPWAMGLAPDRRDRYPVTSVRQAVDILCALWILPPSFSSAYRVALAVNR